MDKPQRINIPHFKQHYVNMVCALCAGDRSPAYEAFAAEQIEFIQYLEAMLHSPSAER